MGASTIFVKANVRRFVNNARREGESMILDRTKLYLLAWGMRPFRGNIWKRNDVTVTYFRPDEVEQQVEVSGQR